MTSIIITGCDSGYFSIAQGLIRSLRRFKSLANQKIGFLDFGLDQEQRLWLAGQGIEIRPGGWDFEFPQRDVWEATRPWFKVYLCRPHLRRHFPDYDVYMWLDADTWVQQPEAVEQLIAAAARGGLAASPEIDRSYHKFIKGVGAWQIELDVALHCLGPELGKRLALTPNFNAGVFAMRRDAPHWDMWRHYLQLGLNRVDAREDVSRMAEQTALNAAVYLHDFRTHRFPSTYNWLACLGQPAWDIAAQMFVEPAPPHQPIGIMHLSLHVLRNSVTIPALYQGEQCFLLTIPLTLEGQETLRQAQPQLLAAVRTSGSKLPAASTTSWPATDYISPGLARVEADPFFPNLAAGDTRNCSWLYLRREIPHRWFVDKRCPTVGFLNRDEVHILYNTALQFRGRRALEVGCWMGWSTCHLALAGVVLDVVDPMLQDAQIHSSVTSSLQAANVLGSVNLLPGSSPQAVRELAARENRKWSLFFVDGDHEGQAPKNDVIECEQYAEQDAAFVFHDLASPDVAAGLRYLRDRGWNTRIYHTMQIMGIAWRGDVAPLNHTPDPRIQWNLPEHLRDFPL